MKIVFMGTPNFAVETLEALLEAGHEVKGVVTQPDKPKGRGKSLGETPVKICAKKHDIPVFQPKKIRDKEAVKQLKNLEADIFVVAAFGQILPKEVLQMPKFGCINVHASLLPKYRGAAPIQWAILNGEKESGVTIMQMDEGLDTGDMLLKESVLLEEKETWESLHDKLAKRGGSLCVKALEQIEEGKVVRERQDNSKSTYAKMISKEFGEVDFYTSSSEIERKVRGLYPWPSAYTYYKGKTLKIWKAQVSMEDSSHCPGTVSRIGKDFIGVSTKDKELKIWEVQLEGKKRMSVKDFLLGYSIKEGEQLGRQK